MKGRSYIVDFYESRNYSGPSVVRAHGVNLIMGPNDSPLFLLNLERELTVDEQPITQILVSTSFAEDPIENITDGACTINIQYVKAGFQLDENSQASAEMSQFWCNGKITPSTK